MKKQIFREAALSRLSALEHVNQPLQVIHPKDWLVLMALALLIFAALLWGILGNVPICVKGKGIILHPPEVQQTTPAQAVIYVPRVGSQMVRPGMTIRLTPLGLRGQRSDTLLGTVKTIADFPATTADMVQSLKNESLVRYFSMGPPSVEIRVTLMPAKADDNRGRSQIDTEFQISKGTLCSATITVCSRRPILLVFPFLEPLLRK